MNEFGKKVVDDNDLNNMKRRKCNDKVSKGKRKRKEKKTKKDQAIKVKKSQRVKIKRKSSTVNREKKNECWK